MQITRPFQRTRFTEQYQMFDLSGLLTRTMRTFSKRIRNAEYPPAGFFIDSIGNELKREKKIEKTHAEQFTVLTGRDTLNSLTKETGQQSHGT